MYSSQRNVSSGASREQPGLRERKAAATRHAIAQALSERLVSREFSSITADELAAAAGVSRITFFNYFPSKEHVIDHLYFGWLFVAECGAVRAGLRGTAVILHIFDSFGALAAQAPMRMRQIAAWFASRSHDRSLPTFSFSDRELLVPGMGHEQLRVPRDLFPAALAEARRLGEPLPPGSDYMLAHMLGAVLAGSVLTGHSKPDQDWASLLRHHVRRILDLDHSPRRAPQSRSRAVSRGKANTRSGRTKGK